jgi:hypothetical protein
MLKLKKMVENIEGKRLLTPRRGVRVILKWIL